MAAAADGARETGGSSVVNISSVAGLTSIKSGKHTNTLTHSTVTVLVTLSSEKKDIRKIIFFYI